MKYATASAFRAALEKRIVTQAHDTGVPVMRLRKLVIFDRLMARLLVVAKDRWILKGAVALDFRLGARFRTTKDMDIARQDGEDAATADFIAAQSIDLGDYFIFAIQKTVKLDAVLENAAVRYHVSVELAGRPFEEAVVDVGFGDPLVFEPEFVRGPDLLTFAGIDPVEVPALPLDNQVAEKVHAYTKSYHGGHPSSRVKDLIDLVVLSSHCRFQAGHIRGTLSAVFELRNTHSLPTKLPAPPREWIRPYRKLAIDIALDPDISAGYDQTAAFLDPVLHEALSDEAFWDPGSQAWLPGSTTS